MASTAGRTIPLSYPKQGSFAGRRVCVRIRQQEECGVCVYVRVMYGVPMESAVSGCLHLDLINRSSHWGYRHITTFQMQTLSLGSNTETCSLYTHPQSPGETKHWPAKAPH